MATVFEPSLAPLVFENYEGNILNNIFHGIGRADFVGGHTYEVCFSDVEALFVLTDRRANLKAVFWTGMESSSGETVLNFRANL